MYTVPQQKASKGDWKVRKKEEAGVRGTLVDPPV
nr:MAG TPA: hypothetical protein [Caudoviricetes sp.]